MKVHNLISQLQEYDPDSEVIIICPNSHEYEIEDLELADTGEVCIETQEPID